MGKDTAYNNMQDCAVPCSNGRILAEKSLHIEDGCSCSSENGRREASCLEGVYIPATDRTPNIKETWDQIIAPQVA